MDTPVYVKIIVQVFFFDCPFFTFTFQWDEVSGHGADKNEYRMLQVCEIQQPNQDNWIRSHYIDTFKANRVFVEIEFTIR